MTNLGMKHLVPLIIFLLFSSAAVPAADVVQSTEDAAKNSSAPWVWPLPPEKPRVRHLMTIMTPQDMGAKKGFFARLWDFLAGEDSVDRIRSPHGIVSDGEGKMYVADWGAGAIHYFNLEKKKYDSFNKTKIGPLISPIALALDQDGRLYVSDSFLRRIFVFDGSKNKRVIGDDSLLRPTGIAINQKEKRLYVVDTAGHRVRIYDLEGKELFSFGGRGGRPGEFNYPTHIALDQTGGVYIMDSLNFRVQMFDKDGAFRGEFGSNGTSIRDFVKPKGIAVDEDGHVWVSDTLRNSIQIFDRQGRLLLIFGRAGTNAGQFNAPAGIFLDSRNRLFIADSYNYRVQIFQYLRENGSN